MMNDQYWMQRALDLAQIAANENEVPVGAIIIKDNIVIAEGYNRREQDNDPLAHAEIIAIKKAAQHLSCWRLENCTLYVTLEPCVMCAGAILQSRIRKIVYGASDPKGGAVKSLFTILNDQRLNHQVEITSGVLADESSLLLKKFFGSLRTRCL